MAKNKKSKILAMTLCAGVMAGIYASPVMAEIEYIDGSNYYVTNGTIKTGTFIGGTYNDGTFNGELLFHGNANMENLLVDGVSVNAAAANGVYGDRLTVGGTTLDFVQVNQTISNTSGITSHSDGKVTTIEGAFSVNENGYIFNKNGSFQVTKDGAITASTYNGVKLAIDGNKVLVGDIDVNDLKDKTQYMYHAAENTTGFKGAVNVEGNIRSTYGGFVIGDGSTALHKGKLQLDGEVLASAKLGTINDVIDDNGNVVGTTVKTTSGADLDVVNNRTQNMTATEDSTIFDGKVTVNGTANITNGHGKYHFDDGLLDFNIDNGKNTFTMNSEHTSMNVGGNTLVLDNSGLTTSGAFKAANGNFDVDTDGNITAGTYNGVKIGMNEDGDIILGDGTVIDDNFNSDNVAGITRKPLDDSAPGRGNTTTIEETFVVDGANNTFGSKNGSFTVDAEDGTFTAAKGAFKVREGVGETVIVGSIISSKDQFGNQGTFNGSNLNLQSADHTRNTSIDAGTAYFVKDGSGTSIDGGAITAKSLLLGTKDVGATIAGIEREIVTDEFGTVNTTTIEGALKVSDNGLISNADGSFTVDSNGGLVAGDGTFAADITGITMKAPVQMTLQGGYNYKGQSVIDLGTTISDIDDRLDVLEDKTQNIKPGTGTGTGTGAGTGEGGTAAGEGNNIIEVPATGEGHTGINGDVTVGGEINAGEIVVGDKGSDNKTTIDGGNVTVNGGENGSTTINGGNITTGDTTITGTGINTGNGKFTGNVDVDGIVTVGGGTTITGEGITTGDGTFTGDVAITGDITAGTGTIGNVDMDNTGIIVGGGTTITEDTVTTGNIKADYGEFGSQVTVGDNTIITDGNINLGGDNGTNINADGMIVGNANGVNTNVSAGDVVITDKDGKDIALSDVGYVENIDRELQANGNYDGTVVGGINAEADIRRAEVNRLDNRISKVEDRVDKVGAMSAAIANLRTMGYDPAAPTEIAVGIGQYRDETGAALGLFHYPNRDFMLSLSVSTSGDEVMGGIGATWKFGRKSPEKVAEIKKAQAEADVRRAEEAKLAKAEEMKQAAKEAKIKAQQERHAKLAAERAAQAEAAK